MEKVFFLENRELSREEYQLSVENGHYYLIDKMGAMEITAEHFINALVDGELLEVKSVRKKGE